MKKESNPSPGKNMIKPDPPPAPPPKKGISRRDFLRLLFGRSIREDK